ncbi:MAG: hypothetical protein QXT00_09210 [Ignisphaera sp.]
MSSTIQKILTPRESEVLFLIYKRGGSVRLYKDRVLDEHEESLQDLFPLRTLERVTLSLAKKGLIEVRDKPARAYLTSKGLELAKKLFS